MFNVWNTECCFLDAETHEKRTPQPLYHIFTSSPISTCLKKAIFKEKAPSNPSKHLEAPNHSEHHQISSPQEKTEVSGLKQGAEDASSEIKVEPHNLAMELSAVTIPSSFESEAPLANNPDEDDTDEDQTIFFTPELFEVEGDEDSPQKETKEESPPRMVLGAESSAPLSEELFSSGQAQGQASGFDGQNPISLSKESTELSQEHKEEVTGQKQGEEREQVDNQSRQSGRRLSRLSRSRQKLPSSPTGN